MKIILLSIFLIFHHVQAWEYCSIQKKICPADTEHIMCKPKVPYEDDANMYILKSAVEMLSTNEYKKFMLELFNNWRNQGAGGEIDKFPKAGRMRELIWDYELEFLSKERNKGLISAKDMCRSTKRFPLVGQYVAPYSYMQRSVSSFYYMNKTMDTMWQARGSVDNHESWAANFTKKMKGRHFAQLLNDRVSRIGCAHIAGFDCALTAGGPVKTPFCLILTCNFDYTWVYYKEIYKAANTPASECGYWGSAGVSKTYKNLCANDGSIHFDKIKN